MSIYSIALLPITKTNQLYENRTSIAIFVIVGFFICVGYKIDHNKDVIISKIHKLPQNEQFYDGEGNLIPNSVVHTLVMAQFTLPTDSEQKVLQKWFYANTTHK